MQGLKVVLVQSIVQLRLRLPLPLTVHTQYARAVGEKTDRPYRLE